MRWAVSRGLTVLVIVTACSAAPDSPATSSPAPTTVPATAPDADRTAASSSGGTTTVPSTTVVSTTIQQVQYRIVDRVEGDEGDTVVVLIDAATYDALTDIDLQNVVEDVVDRFPPILTVHVVDDIAAARTVLDEVAAGTDQGRELLMVHYLVRLEEGFRLVYQGPFTDTASVIIGS